MKVLLIGGTGNISSSITRRCLERGDEVWLFNRGHDRSFEAMGAHYIIGNAMDHEDLKAKLKDQWFDVAANFIIYRFEDSVATFEALNGHVGQFFFISSCTVYQKPCYNTPITPDTPLKNPYSAYARTKIQGEFYFLERYREELQLLDAAFRKTVDEGSHRTLVFADRFPVRYFVEEYGLEYFAAFPGCADDTEPAARTVAFLIDRVREEKLPAVFYIEFSNEKMADVVCEDTGCRKLLFHSCHNVSAADLENGVTYLQLMWGNVNALKEALG